MPGFQFELSQLVNVPGKDGLQGRVSSRMEYVNGRSTYGVMWLTDALEAMSAPFAENDLAEAQKRKPDSTLTMKVEVDDTEMKKATDAANELRAAADAAAASVDRLPRNVLRLRTSKRKSRR